MVGREGETARRSMTRQNRDRGSQDCGFALDMTGRFVARVVLGDWLLACCCMGPQHGIHSVDE